MALPLLRVSWVTAERYTPDGGDHMPLQQAVMAQRLQDDVGVLPASTGHRGGPVADHPTRCGV